MGRQAYRWFGHLRVAERLPQCFAVTYLRPSRTRLAPAAIFIDSFGLELGERSQDLIALDDALTALAMIDARKSEVVELRFWRLSLAETAESLHVSPEIASELGALEPTMADPRYIGSPQDGSPSQRVCLS
jgi:hypothetical protein